MESRKPREKEKEGVEASERKSKFDEAIASLSEMKKTSR